MVDRMLRDDWWRAHERYLSYLDAARNARARADDPKTSGGDRRKLLEREAYWTMRANEHLEKAKHATPS